MTEILLTHSYFLHFDEKEHRAMMPYPPLGPLYAVSVLREAGFSVAFHDTMLSKSENEIVSALHQHKPKIVAIYDDQFNYLTKMCLRRMREAAFIIAQLAKAYGAQVIAFSSDASDHAEEYLANGVDFVLCGEAEVTITELCRFLLRDSQTSIAGIKGLIFRNETEIAKTPRRELMTHLDEIPFPAWDLAGLDKYRSVWKRKHGYFSVNIVTTRGCPFHCNWCAKPIYGQVYHNRTPENVVSEMKFLKQFAQPDHIWFADDIFGLKPGWISQFDEIVNREHVKIPFKCLSRVDLLLKEDNIYHLKNAGCRTVWVGAESGSQKILDAMEKGTTIQQIHESTALLRRERIRVGFFLQFGYPGETMLDIEKTIRMVKELAPDEIGISISYPLPGTKFYDNVRSQLGTKRNWIDSRDLDLLFAGEYHPDFYRSLHRVVHKRFSIWRGLRSMKSLFEVPTHITRQGMRNVVSMLYHSLTLPFELVKLQRLGQLSHAGNH